MIFDMRYLIILFLIFLVDKMLAQTSIIENQSTKLIKSVLTQVGSSNVIYDYTDAAGTTKTNKVQQSIGQNGVVGLSKISINSVQQGFLNNIKVYKIDNTNSDFVETINLSPNPFKDFINIKFSKLTTYPVVVEVFDIRGRLVLNQQFQPTSLVSIRTNWLAEMSYIIRVSSGDQKFIKKLIKGIY